MSLIKRILINKVTIYRIITQIGLFLGNMVIHNNSPLRGIYYYIID